MREVEWKVPVVLFLLFCAWGVYFEWFSGFFWSIVGSTPWIYPDSPLRYTSWQVIPLWGLGGLAVLQLTKAVRRRDKLALAYAAGFQLLTLIWMIILVLLI
jgi:hypothetical protein